MFADADDMLLPGACETAVGLMKETKADIVQFSVDFEAERRDGDALDKFLRVFRSREMESHGTNILYDCFVNHRFVHNLWNKIYRAEICKKAVEAMPDIQLHLYTDLYLSFFILFFAESYRSLKTKPCYRYHFGGGVSTKTPDAEQFRNLCEVSKTLPLMEKFLRDRNAYETNVSVLDAIHSTLRQDMVNKLLTIPNLTREIISAAIESWGGDIIFDFLSETGMFKYPCESRLSIVSNLIDQYKADRRKSRNSSPTWPRPRQKCGRCRRAVRRCSVRRRVRHRVWGIRLRSRRPSNRRSRPRRKGFNSGSCRNCRKFEASV